MNMPKLLELIKKSQKYRPFICVYHNSFDDPEQVQEITSDMPRQAEFTTRQLAMKAPAGLLPEIIPAYRYPLLERDQEQHLFRKMNYFKHLTNKFQSQLTSQHAVEQFEKSRQLAISNQDLAFGCNYRLIIMHARKYGRNPQDFIERISHYSAAMLSSINKFDFSFGIRFSTYAYRALFNAVRNCSRGRREAPTVPLDEHLDKIKAPETDQDSGFISEQLKILLSGLDKRERRILSLRSGFELSPSGSRQRWRLQEIGEALNITKERVRQIELEALDKLRAVASPQSFGLEGWMKEA